jgi:hypothetical protein
MTAPLPTPDKGMREERLEAIGLVLDRHAHAVLEGRDKSYSHVKWNKGKYVLDINKLFTAQLEGLREQLKSTETPYPSDIFTPISSEEWNQIDDLLAAHMGFRIDRVSGNLCRKGFSVAKLEALVLIDAAIKEGKDE